MNKLVALALVTVTFASTGCAVMSTKRREGGAQITKTAPAEETKTVDGLSGMGERADLGER